jgi:hypothetical protein
VEIEVLTLYGEAVVLVIVTEEVVNLSFFIF